MNGPGFEVLYEDGPCLVVLKPPGVLTQAPPGIDSLEVRVKDFLRRREGRSGNVYLGVPHRLDRPASGALVLARTSRAARRLAEQFEARLVKKLYWACVEGQLGPDCGTWEDHVRKVPDEPRAEIAPAGRPGARPAVLHYRALAAQAWGTWLEIRLATGRMHQVRVQAASRGHPVLGDAQYGSAVAFGPQHADPRLRAIALHARAIAFRHPKSMEDVCVTAPLPAEWKDLGLPAEGGAGCVVGQRAEGRGLG